jgi:hypothetical protein
MPLQVMTTGFLVLGLVLTVYCVVRLALRYRVVARDLAAYEDGREAQVKETEGPDRPAQRTAG